MHQSVMDWLGRTRWRLGILTSARVLEVGSYNENGSAREVFTPDLVGSYVGVDVRPGRDVDQVADAADLPFEDGSFDLVICTEMLEHDPRPWRSIPEMARVLRRGGTLLVTARGFDEYQGCYGRHDCPADYWRFNTSSLEVLLRDAGLHPVALLMDPDVPGVFGHATKP